jgi:hypothetical protein
MARNTPTIVTMRAPFPLHDTLRKVFVRCRGASMPLRPG